MYYGPQNVADVLRPYLNTFAAPEALDPNPIVVTHHFSRSGKSFDILGLRRNTKRRYIGSAILNQHIKSENKEQRGREALRLKPK